MEDDTEPPSQNCIEWMCDDHLEWKIYDMNKRKFWTYSSNHEIESWKQCYKNSFSREYTMIKQGTQY